MTSFCLFLSEHTVNLSIWTFATCDLILICSMLYFVMSPRPVPLQPIYSEVYYIPLRFNQFFIDTMVEINYQWSSRCITHTYTTGWPCFLYRRSTILEQSPRLTLTNRFRRCFQKTTEDFFLAVRFRVNLDCLRFYLHVFYCCNAQQASFSVCCALQISFYLILIWFKITYKS